MRVTYLIFVTSTTSSAGVKFSGWCQIKYELVCLGVKIVKLVFFGGKKSGISVFLVSVENGAGVNKMTNITYGWMVMLLESTYFFVAVSHHIMFKDIRSRESR